MGGDYSITVDGGSQKAMQGELTGDKTSEIAKKKIVQVPYSADFPRDHVEQAGRDEDKSRK